MDKKFEQFVKKLCEDFPDVKIVPAKVFYWNPYEREVGYPAPDSNENWDASALLLLHELAHASLGHEEYDYDMELIGMENAAWTLVEEELAKKYSLVFDEKIAEKRLNTYRDWLLERASCPGCKAFGFQQDNRDYICGQCGAIWKPNDNRFKRIWKSLKTAEKPIFCDFWELGVDGASLNQNNLN